MNDRPQPSRRELGLIAVVLAYMAIQITVPVTHMPFRYETAFAWKMYSYQRSAPFELRLIMADGRAVGWRDVPNRAELVKIARCGVVIKPRAFRFPPATSSNTPAPRPAD